MKRLGFGCMRLPKLENGEVDIPQVCRMVDLFLERGFTYFDTARPYIGGKSELALKAALTSRHPRDSYLLADKLSSSCYTTGDEIRPFVDSQLAACGVDHFDYYLIHSVHAENYEKYQSTGAFETLQQLKAEGKLRRVGFSFHDSSAVLDRILTEHPEMEFVQLQFNYADYDDPGVESWNCYQVCEKHGKPVIVMEPVRGGALADLPAEAAQVLAALDGGSPASYAVRFAASFPRNIMVLSGMSTLAQLDENTAYMQNFRPLTEAEHAAVSQVRGILRAQGAIGCTACRYCTAGCPKNIDIPVLFSCYNSKMRYNDWSGEEYYDANTRDKGKASDCIRCGKCEAICPQHLPIRDLLRTVADTFEKK